MKNTILNLNDLEREALSNAFRYALDLSPHPEFEMIFEKVINSKPLTSHEIFVVHNILEIYRDYLVVKIPATPVISEDCIRLHNLFYDSDQLIIKLERLMKKENKI